MTDSRPTGHPLPRVPSVPGPALPRRVRGLAGSAILLSILLAAAGSIAEPASGKQLRQQLELLNPPALQRAAEYLATTWPALCGPQLPAWKKDLDQLQARLEALRRRASDDPQAIAETRAALELQRRILLANPILRDFSSVLLVRRNVNAPSLGLPANWESNCVLPRRGYGNDLAVLAPFSPGAPLTTLYRPAKRGCQTIGRFGLPPHRHPPIALDGWQLRPTPAEPDAPRRGCDFSAALAGLGNFLAGSPKAPLAGERAEGGRRREETDLTAKAGRREGGGRDGGFATSLQGMTDDIQYTGPQGEPHKLQELVLRLSREGVAHENVMFDRTLFAPMSA